MDGQTYVDQNILLGRDFVQDDENTISSVNSYNNQNISIPFISVRNSNFNPSQTFFIPNQENQETDKAYEDIFCQNDYDIINIDKDDIISPFEKLPKKKPDVIINVPVKKKKEKIFKIIKVTRKRGRRSNAYKAKHKNVRYEHGKTRDDNVIRKLKVSFTNKILEYVNIIYENEYRKLHTKSPKTHWLQKLSGKSKTFIRKDENLKWLNMKLKDYLSSKVSTKNKHFEIGHNAKEIKKVLDEEKMEDLINILNTDIKTLLKQYATKEEIIKYDGVSFPYIEEDFKEENAKDEEEKECIKRIKEVAEKFESIFNGKKDRKSNV